MTARAFLVRGLLAGLLAGFAAFLVGYTVAEPHIQAAINYEESQDEAQAAGHDATAAEEPGHHEEDGTVVSRDNQRTWGLLTGALGVGVALGGIVALVSAGLVGRIGRLRPGQTVALVAAVGWASVIFVPFLKYPASPPAVGNADTIGSRTAEYFAYVLISLVAVVAAAILARALWSRLGAYAVVAGVVAYLAVMVIAGQLMPTVNEVGDFPADTLWYFRRASLITTGTMWAVIGVVLSALVSRLYASETKVVARRELAASL